MDEELDDVAQNMITMRVHEFNFNNLMLICNCANNAVWNILGDKGIYKTSTLNAHI